MNDAHPSEVVLSPEDAARAQRLAEEVQGRLEELAALSCRALGKPLTPDMVRKFVASPRSGSALDEPAFHHVELLETPTNPPIPVTVIYYDDGTVSVTYGPFTP